MTSPHTVPKTNGDGEGPGGGADHALRTDADVDSLNARLRAIGEAATG